MNAASQKDLLATLEKIAGTNLLVIGDIILDRYIWGRVDRISQEAPVPVVEVSRVEDRLGGAGNVVRNLRSLGALVTLCGFVGNDEEAEKVYGLLSGSSVNRTGVVVDSDKPTILKTRVIAHNQQVVRIDREDKSFEHNEAQESLLSVIDSEIEKVKGVMLSDYGKGAITAGVIQKLSEATAKKRLGLGIRPLILDPSPRNYELYNKVTVAKPNRREAEIASGIEIRSVEDGIKAGRTLLKKWEADLMLITLGEDGMVVVGAGAEKGVHLETRAQEVYDVSGAGDTVTALFGAALAVGATPAVAGALANIGAGIVVSEVGTVAVELDQLKAEILKH